PNSPYRTVVPGELLATNDAGPSDLAIDHDQTTYLRGAEVHLWDKRSFYTPVAAQLGGPVQIVTQLLPDEKRMSVKVTNRTRYALHECALINDNETVPLGDLAPGETSKSLTLRWAKPDTTLGLRIPPSKAAPPPTLPGDTRMETPEETRRKIREALTQ